MHKCVYLIHIFSSQKVLCFEIKIPAGENIEANLFVHYQERKVKLKYFSDSDWLKAHV